MKKIVRVLLLSVSFVLLFASVGMAAPTIYLNGNKINKETMLKDGVTYLPIRAISEALNLNVEFDANTQSVYLTDQSQSKNTTSPSKPTPVNTKEPLSLSNVGVQKMIKIDGKVYSYPRPMILRKDENNKFYAMPSSFLGELIYILSDKYEVEKSDNPYLNGYISSVEGTKNIEFKDEYLSATKRYTVGKYYNLDKSKYYEYSTNPEKLIGVIQDGLYNDEYYIPLDDLFKTFGINATINYDQNEQITTFELK